MKIKIEAGRTLLYETSRVVDIALAYDKQFENNKPEDKDKAKRSTRFRKTCKNAVKALAREFEGRYGKPRGKGWDGEWFAFRQSSETMDKSLRLYSNRCRTGIYSMVLTDEKVRRGNQAGEAGTK